jgi:hypothetical protein
MTSHHAGEDPAGRARNVRPDPDVIGQRIGDECVLVHPRTDRIYALNRTGARVWELLNAGYDRARVHEQMLQEFEVSPAQLARDIDAVLTSLQHEGLVTAQTEE